MAKRVCAFCGRTPVTGEHVWPEWLVGMMHAIVDAADREAEFKDGAFNSERHGKILTSKKIEERIKRVCKACNEGWMSDIENGSRSLLLPLVFGLKPDGPPPVSPSDQAIMARWGFKTALMVKHIVPELILSPTWYHDFYRDKTPPPTCVILVAAHTAETNIINAWDHSGTLRRLEGPPGMPAVIDFAVEYVSLTYHFFQLAFRVLFLEGRSDYVNNFVSRSIHIDGAYRIWPVSPLVLPWPPNGKALSDAGLQEFGTRLV